MSWTGGADKIFLSMSASHQNITEPKEGSQSSPLLASGKCYDGLPWRMMQVFLGHTSQLVTRACMDLGMAVCG